MGDPASMLTLGCLQQMFTDGEAHPQDPIVQCLQIKPMQSQQSGVERYRIVLSDSRNFIQSMLGSRKSYRSLFLAKADSTKK